MSLPLQILFRNTDASSAVDARIRRRVAALERVATDLTSCHVTVEPESRHSHSGRRYEVRVDLRVAGGEVVTTRHADEDVYAAVRDAFDATRRQLREFARRRRGDVKAHARKAG